MAERVKYPTPTGRFMYPALAETEKLPDGTDSGKYAIQEILDALALASPEWVRIKDAIAAEAAAAAKEWKVPVNNVRLPYRPNEEKAEKNAAYTPGGVFLTAKSKFQPPIVDIGKRPVTDATAVFSGCEGRLVVSIYRYNVSGNRGIGLSLELVQVTNFDKDKIGGGGGDALNLLSDLPDPFAA